MISQHFHNKVIGSSNLCQRSSIGSFILCQNWIIINHSPYNFLICTTDRVPWRWEGQFLVQPQHTPLDNHPRGPNHPRRWFEWTREWMNEWRKHLYSTFIVYCCTPKALYNHMRGSLLNHQQCAASTWMMWRQPQDNGASALTTHQLQVERRES